MSKKYNRNVYPAVVSVSADECNGGLGVLYLSGGSAKAVRTACGECLLSDGGSVQKYAVQPVCGSHTYI